MRSRSAGSCAFSAKIPAFPAFQAFRTFSKRGFGTIQFPQILGWRHLKTSPSPFSRYCGSDVEEALMRGFEGGAKFCVHRQCQHWCRCTAFKHASITSSNPQVLVVETSPACLPEVPVYLVPRQQHHHDSVRPPHNWQFVSNLHPRSSLMRMASEILWDCAMTTHLM
jgi:hypothetical protein